MEVMYFRESSEFREWLEENHSHSKEIWLGFLKKRKGIMHGFYYPEAVEIALCYGWIDGLTRSVDESRYKVRFTPRKNKSVWSSINIKRVETLKEAGLMHPAGLAVYEARNKKRTDSANFLRENGRLTQEMEQEFMKHPNAYVWFCNASASYRKTCIYWILSARQDATRTKRLGILIECSGQQVRIPLLRTDPGHRRPRES